MKNFRYFIDTITSWAYWQYVLFSVTGIKSVLSVFGLCYLIIEALDFFGMYTRDKYASYSFFILFIVSTLISVFVRRPVKSIFVRFPKHDFCIEVRIADLFEATGAIVISTNTDFEADVAGGKIAPDSLQGQFTAKYYTGNQNTLIQEIKEELKNVNGSPPYDFGTVVPITTHGKTFYFTAMSVLNASGNASTTVENVRSSLSGLWEYVRNSGELQELALPIIGTGRGRLRVSRKKMITIIAESFVKASEKGKITNKLILIIRPGDASNFGVNLYDIKDNLRHVLFS